MIPAGLKAGSMAYKMLKTLYKAKKGVRAGANKASLALGAKGAYTSAQVAKTVGKKVTQGSRATGKFMKKYPKASSFAGGVATISFLDD